MCEDVDLVHPRVDAPPPPQQHHDSLHQEVDLFTPPTPHHHPTPPPPPHGDLDACLDLNLPCFDVRPLLPPWLAMYFDSGSMSQWGGPGTVKYFAVGWVRPHVVLRLLRMGCHPRHRLGGREAGREGGRALPSTASAPRP